MRAFAEPPLPSTRRRFLLSLLIVVMLAVAAELAVRRAQVDELRDPIERALGERLGLRVDLAGDLKASLLSGLNLHAGDVSVANLPGRASPTLLRAGAVDLSLALWPLLWDRRVEIHALRVRDVELRVEPDAAGNFALPPGLESSGDAVASNGELRLSIGSLEFAELRVLYQAATDAEPTLLRFEELALATGHANGEIALAMLGAADGRDFDLTGRAGPASELFAPTRPYPLALRGRVFGARVALEGSIELPRELRGVDLDLRIEDSDLVSLGRLLGTSQALPELAPLHVAARLRDREGTLALGDVVAFAGERTGAWAEARGHVHDVAGMREVLLDGEFGGATSRELEPLLGRSLPDLGALDGSFELADHEGAFALVGFRLRGGRGTELRFDVEAGRDDLHGRDGASLRAKLEARDLSVLGALAGRELPAVGPVAFSGRASGSDQQIVSNGETRLGSSRLEGSWSLSLPEGERPRFSGELHSAHLRLEDLGLLSAPESATPAKSPGEEPLRGPLGAPLWASPEPLPFERLRELDAQLTLRVERLTGGNGIDAHDLVARIALEAGRLTVSPLSGTYEQGEVHGGLRIDARRDPPEVGLFLDVVAVDLQRLADLVPGNQWTAGSASLWVDVDSSGHSPQALRENLSGMVHAMLHEGTLAPRYAERFSRNLVRVAFPGLEQAKPQGIGCFRTELHVDRGSALATQLVLQGETESVTGSGRIDLGRGVYDLKLTPHTTRPGLIRVAAQVRVTGPLASPVFEPVRGTMAQQFVGNLVENALRPAEVIRGVLLPRERAQDPCEAPLVMRAAVHPPEWVERR